MRTYYAGGRITPTGEMFRQPNLAATLRALAAAEQDARTKGATREQGIEAGRDAFYKGLIAQRMTAAVRAAGGVMTDEDLAAIIVYLRSVPPVRNQLPQTKIPFPLSRLIQNAPQPVTEAVTAQDGADAVKRGAYLVRMGGCFDCHTPLEKGQPMPGLEFAGGFTLKHPGGEVAAANITPHATGISYYDENLFLDMIRTGHVRARTLNPIMPWVVYRGMTDEDLKALFAYLRTLNPVNHAVDNTEQPTACKLCKQQHGLGERN
jgi:mono/diheme cytochrome c family protein